MAAALVKAATPGTIKGLKDGTVNLVAGNCRQFNDTCFDWGKPGKYKPQPPPPPPKAEPAPAPPPSPPNAAYDNKMKSQNQTSTLTRQAMDVATTARAEHPATIVSKGGAIASRASDHASETMDAHLAQTTTLLSAALNTTVAGALFHNLPIATNPPSRRSLFSYPWS